ncbi:MarR family winged helix-turn-helix transcriptional regulator [Sphingobacterium sp. BN32]|uniref:MarR family winged helix-turn-helix transcriptional regulator n=1 Tax=Sphingobacterium sp. BN32 TaxID=3058432 RepID=UPI00265CA8D0|nr:MarR family winged helix-turn-helix transcriptional regulator [Sphingobacterium sp. BN32]WKK60245.1 MarR family winged helix-turn-helix transcriptional regulator [Sphingobacterium sp. BN32]
MKYNILKDMIALLEDFEAEVQLDEIYTRDTEGFIDWLVDRNAKVEELPDVEWEGKEKGRSAESVINTLLVHMGRYAKSYSKSAIHGSDFTSQDDFIYLITLKSFGEMTKMDLIKKNVHEKPSGILIINRLIAQGWVEQFNSSTDKRSKVLRISEKGIAVLEQQMDKIRMASDIVTGNLTSKEKLELIRLLDKLDVFHLAIYDKQIDSEHLLNEGVKSKKR